MDGDSLKALREGRGQGQAEFAAYLNEKLVRKYDRHRLSKWETGAERIPQAVVDLLYAEIGNDRQRHARVIAVGNQKGGVGKTATAVNLAYLLSAGGAKVLLIDADSQSNGTFHVGFTPKEVNVLEESHKTLYEALVKDTPLPSLILETAYPRLYVVPASISLADADGELASPTRGITVLREQIDRVRTDFDYIIIDCAPNLSFVTSNAFVAADYILIPVQTEPFPLIGLKRLLGTVTLLQRRANPDLKVLGILPTMYQSRLTQDKESLADVKSAFGAQFRIFTPVPRATVYAQSAGYRLPTLAHEAKAPGYESYHEIVAALAADQQEEVRHA